MPAIFLVRIQYPEFKADAFKSVRVVMSEAAPVMATLDQNLSLEKTGSTGKAVLHLDARIVDSDMKKLPAEDVGELVI